MVSRDWLYQTRSLSKLARRVPLLGRVAETDYGRAFAQAEHCNIFRGVYETFAQAASAVPATKIAGYDQAATAEMYRERLLRVWPSDYPALFWLRDALPSLRSVFDFGGHVGVARYAYARYLDFPDDLSWTVCDVPAVVEAGRRLAQERGMKNLEFITDRHGAAAADLFFSSGAFQYLDWTLPDLLAQIERPKRLLLNLLPITELPTYFTLQNIGTAFCPYRIMNRQELFGGLERLGYRLVDHWENAEKSCYIPFHLERSLDHYEGAYLVLDEAKAQG